MSRPWVSPWCWSIYRSGIQLQEISIKGQKIRFQVDGFGLRGLIDVKAVMAGHQVSEVVFQAGKLRNKAREGVRFRLKHEMVDSFNGSMCKCAVVFVFGTNRLNIALQQERNNGFSFFNTMLPDKDPGQAEVGFMGELRWMQLTIGNVFYESSVG